MCCKWDRRLEKGAIITTVQEQNQFNKETYTMTEMVGGFWGHCSLDTGVYQSKWSPLRI